MKRLVATLGVLINTLIFACYYFVVKGTLAHWDPLLFIGAAALLALPVGTATLFVSRDQISRDTLKWGMVLGGTLALVFVGLTNALRSTTATETAYFPCLNGIIAAFMLRFTGKPVSKVTWAMACLSVGGMALLVLNAPILADHWRGDLEALLATIAYVGAAFLLDTFLSQSPTHKTTWAMLGVACVSLTLTAASVDLVFGNWSLQPQVPQSIWSLLFMGLLVLVSTMIIGVFSQQQVGASTLVFIAILEPILADLGAAWFLHERYPPVSYLGAALGILAVLGQSLLPGLLERMSVQKTGDVGWCSDPHWLDQCQQRSFLTTEKAGSCQKQSTPSYQKQWNKQQLTASRAPVRSLRRRPHI